MTASSVPELRPLGLGELLDRAIRLYRRNFIKFIGIIAIVQIPISVFQFIAASFTVTDFDQFGTADFSNLDNPFAAFPPTYWIGIILTLIGAGLSFLLVQGIGTAALTRSVSDHYMGEDSGILDSYEKIGKSWPTLVGALFLGIVIVFLLLFFVIIPCIGWLVGPGGLVFFAAVVLPLIAPVVVLERKSAVGSLRRAWDLARKRFWWLIGFVLILYIFTQIVIGAPSLLLTAVFQFILPEAITAGSTSTLFLIQNIITALFTLLFTVLYLPFQLTCITLVYFDLRVRFEGLDLILLTHEASGGGLARGEIPATTPAAESTSLVTANDVISFILLTVGAGILFGIIYSILIVIFGAIFGLGAGLF